MCLNLFSEILIWYCAMLNGNSFPFTFFYFHSHDTFIVTAIPMGMNIPIVPMRISSHRPLCWWTGCGSASFHSVKFLLCIIASSTACLCVCDRSTWSTWWRTRPVSTDSLSPVNSFALNLTSIFDLCRCSPLKPVDNPSLVHRQTVINYSHLFIRPEKLGSTSMFGATTSLINLVPKFCSFSLVAFLR